MADATEQDDFSNVTWSEHVHDQTSRPMPPAEEPGHTLEIEQDPPSLGTEKLECVVGSAIKENDGTKDAFVSYLITTRVR